MNIQQEKEFAKYANRGFSQEQLEEIRLGIEQGFDVGAYARTSISPQDMSHIRKSMNYRRKVESETVSLQTNQKEEQKEMPVKSIKKRKKMTVDQMMKLSIIGGAVSIVVALIVIAVKI